MKHARSDYDRIQDPAGLIPEDEPVLLIRGQDKIAPMVLQQYVKIAEFHNVDQEIIDAVKAQIRRMKHWQETVKCKKPDMPASA